MTTNTEREELAQTIADAADKCLNIRSGRPPMTHDFQAADAILAAGYSKPRTITTYEDLDALPIGSLILTEQGGYWESVRRTDGRNRWLEPSQPEDAWLAVSEDLTLPATVLHTPEPTK